METSRAPTLLAALALVAVTAAPAAALSIDPADATGPATEAQTSDDDSYPYANADGTPVGEAVDFLRSEQGAGGNVSGLGISGWVAIAAVHAGEDPENWTACDTCPSLEQHLVTEGADREAEGRTFVPGENATDWARQLLALSLAGADVRDADGVDYVDGLMTTFDGEQFGHPDLMWDDYTAILALTSTDAAETDATVADAVDAAADWVRANQFPDGGWSWRSLDSVDPFFVAFGPTGDVDSTAAALQALTAAGEDPDSLAVERGLTFIGTHQYRDGGCGSAVLFDTVFNAPLESNTGSTSWATAAVVATDGDPTSAQWTQPSGNDLVDFLVSMQRDDGGFAWTASNPEGHTDDTDVWMTAYAVTALTGSTWVAG